MRLASLLVPLVVLGVAVGCGEDMLEPGALTITVSADPPELTNDLTVQLVGQVTRTPAASGVTIVVTATGGTSAVTDTASADGSFDLTVGLSVNAITQIQITASDASGSTATPASFNVRHDNTAAAVVSSTPAPNADRVTGGTVSFAFSEPIRPGSATISVTQQGVAVPGSSALSADSLTLTFVPAMPFAVNAIHSVALTGARDAVGNTSAGSVQCFATGGAGITSFADDAGDLFTGGTPPATLVPPDLRELRFARGTEILYTIVEFDAPRSLSPTAANNTTLWIDFDTDQDGATGFTTLKDTVFSGSGLVGPSGAGAEYMIHMGSLLNTPPDTGFVGMYTAQDSWTGALFRPSFCGNLIGFAIPFAALGADDGAFDIVLYVDAYDPGTDGAIIDVAPDDGVLSVNLTTAVATAPTGSAPELSPTVPQSRRWPMRRPARDWRVLRQP
jgi:hypothetical protein